VETVKAVLCHQGALTTAVVPDPEPAAGQVLLRVLRCGICGSDLHARRAGDELADVMVEAGYDRFMRAEQHVVLGHEFVGEVVEFGPGCRRKVPTGSPVVAFPLVRKDGEVHPIGLSAAAPG
jgi:threonine dehydrogenase-like Zn-dependent dehydrogenase